MSKIEMPNLDKLREINQRLTLLLEDPHPGLMSWSGFLYDVLEEITEFTYPDFMRDLHAAEELYEDAIAKANAA